MLRKLLVVSALMLSSAPTLAAATSSSNSVTPKGEQQYEIKKVCRTVDELGSRVPQRTCTTKKVPIKPKDPAADADAEQTGSPEGGR